MLFFVKSECDPSKVDELTQKVINGEIAKVRGNIVFISPDGTTGFDIIEAKDEADVRSKYAAYKPFMRLVEVAEILPAHEYYEHWEMKHAASAAIRR